MVKTELNSEQKETWSAYLQSEKRTMKDFIDVVQNTTFQLPFQEQAIELLLAPDISKLQHPNCEAWRGRNCVGSPKNGDATIAWVKMLTKEQAEYAADLLMEYIPPLLEDVKVRHTGDSDTLDTYNRIIPYLLQNLPQGQADALFSLYDERFGPHFTMYITDLLQSNIDESWKRKALGRIHRKIEETKSLEHGGSSEYRQEMSFYGFVLPSMITPDGLAVSTKLFEDELNYILNAYEGKPPFYNDLYYRAYVLIQDNNIRYKYARKVWIEADAVGMCDYNFYSISNKSELLFAQNVLKDFPEDKELQQRLTALIQKYTEQKVRKEHQQIHEMRRDVTLYERMKKSDVGKSEVK